jgi:hypothetical protein
MEEGTRSVSPALKGQSLSSEYNGTPYCKAVELLHRKRAHRLKRGNPQTRNDCERARQRSEARQEWDSTLLLVLPIMGACPALEVDGARASPALAFNFDRSAACIAAMYLFPVRFEYSRFADKLIAPSRGLVHRNSVGLGDRQTNLGLGSLV